jgi:hypothetical protein
MPTPDPSGRISSLLSLNATMQGLDAAYVSVTELAKAVSVKIGTVDVAVTLLDRPAAVRRTLTDALAQLDAIAAETDNPEGT